MAMNKARDLLKSVYGYDSFRPGQSEIIEAVLSGEPVMAIMPTGSGKSMCFQLPSMIDHSLTVVVSPLIALMRDQVGQLQALGVAAMTLNSQTNATETRETWAAIKSGKLRLLYLSPERLAMTGLIDALCEAGVKRVAVDEAHCISAWGHDFRPEYRLIRAAVEKLGNPQVIAFTATADKAMQTEIAGQLFDRDCRLFVQSFDRPNLTLNFLAKEDPRRQIERFMEPRRGQSGIIYCSSRAATEKLAEHLSKQGHKAYFYHAGMEQTQRNANQDRFLREDGIVITATNAFGMGISKPDVRFVIHADLPPSVEAYYQEIGRAGRDGLPADTLTLYGLDDMALRRSQIDGKDISEKRRWYERRCFDALVSLCEASSCRRQILLAHFDEQAPRCGTCDVCQGKVKLRDGSIEAQKALSAVVRTGQRFGAGYLCDLLTGSANETLARNGHENLPTFGVGKDRSKRDWTSTYRQLFAAGALRTASSDHGGFAMTDKGKEIMCGREPFQMREDPPREDARSRKRGAAVSIPSGGEGARMFEKLRRLRLELARENGFAAYMIFADKTLIEMSERKPATRRELCAISGVGDRKADLYGDRFLQAIAAAA